MDWVTRRIKLFHFPPYTLAVFFNWHPESRDPFVGDVDNMLCEVKEGQSIVVTSEQKDLPIKLREPIKR